MSQALKKEKNTIVTLDGRSFEPTIIRNTISTDCSIDCEQHSYLDFFFVENNKKHFARQKTHYDKEEDAYIVDNDTPAEWYVEE